MMITPTMDNQSMSPSHSGTPASASHPPVVVGLDSEDAQGSNPLVTTC